MNSWILILTLIPQNNYGGAAIQQVPGFETRLSCEVAGKTWAANQEAVQSQLNFIPTIVCIEQKTVQ